MGVNDNLHPWPFLSPIHLVVAADVKQDDFLLRHLKHQGDTVAVSQTDGVQALKLSLQRMQVKVGLKRILV